MLLGHTERMPEDTEPQVSSDAVPRRGLVVKVVAIVVVLALVAGAGFLAFSVLTAEPQRSITLPATAAGMKRDTELEQKNPQGFEGTRTQIGQITKLRQVAVGAYDNTDEKAGPPGPVVVAGGGTTSEIDPDELLGSLASTAKANGATTTSVDVGDDATALCSTRLGSDEAQQCTWATPTSLGLVIVPEPGWSLDQLAALTTKLRADLETED